MIPETLTYTHGERTFAGHFTRPGGPGPAPGVLVFHGGAGLSDHEREWCARLAEAGYAAFAPDLFGKTFRDRAHAMTVIQGLAGDPDLLRGRLAAALTAVRAHPAVDAARCAAIGFCFGGMAALELARSGADITAAVSLHGGLTTRRPAQLGAVKARILVCTGGDDPYAPAEHRDALQAELTAAGATWTMTVFGGVLHGFTHRDIDPATSPGNAYNALADKVSWQSVLALLGGA